MSSPSTNYTDLEIASKRKPAELFHLWTADEATHWRYTSHDAPVTYDGNVYQPAMISRGENEKDVELEVSKMSIKVSSLSDPIKDDLTARTAQRIWAAVYKLHKEDLTVAAVIFVGQVKGTVFDGVNCTIECVGFEQFLHQIVPKDRYQPTCNKTLFDSRCRLVAATYATLCTISAIDSDMMILTCTGADAQADGYFNLGFVNYSGHRRMISSHVGEDILLRFPISTVATQTQITLYPGCDKLQATCTTKWNNLANFLGFPNIPYDNPCLWT